MTLSMLQTVEPSSISDSDKRAAQDASRALAQLSGRGSVHVEAEAANGSHQTFVLPAAAVRLLTDMLVHLADGRAVSVMPENAELTTRQAADMLNVSRPHLVKLMGEGAIDFHMVGTHRRLLLEDVISFKARRHQETGRAMDELAAEAQELGMGY
ncbi:excisionase family DNA-binding protein [Acidisoma silvae]|uniref:excisionase family DNA-binding protein n=1 Tax=Acidisoma silvae TaxID=2802396 RepID=UPI001D0AD22F|nr:excisionase family DNA-binding protein [Acidisoma silvae]